ncbi:MAG: FAD-binding protein [Sphingobacteriales bacterium 50-39]|nr:FAD-binding oxidoreductase [Sphingobacteriales bacterium]OJW59625.1 MAG: FAD-binding protein [Sphingobacteriales bacterium 50-39]
MKIIKTGFSSWENRHETFVETIRDLYELGNDDSLPPIDSYNDTTKGLQQIIADAIAKKIPLRALGAGWSWTKIATAEAGIMLDTKPLNMIFDISGPSVATSYKGDPTKLFLAQCGNGVWELSRFLKNRNLSLKTSGASNGQTIAGVIATGAHGSAFDVGAVQDFVVGLHIIVSPTRHIWLERKSYPVVSDNLIRSLQTELVQDDDLFNSALVSFGSFGIIHGAMIETESIFLLEAYMSTMPFDNSLQQIMQTLDFTNSKLPYGSERPFHFAVSLNPYDLDKGAYVTTMYKRPYKAGYTPPVRNLNGLGPGDDAPCFIGKITQVIPSLVPTLVTKLLASSLTPYSQQFGTMGEIFDNTTLHGRLLSAAIGIPISYVSKATDLLLAINKSNGPFAGLFAYRFVKKSNAKLAFTKFDYTCVLELDAAFSDETYAFYTAVWKKFEEENIPFAFHWGKINELDFNRLTNMYGDDLKTWLASRNKLLDADSKKVFTNATLTKWGLDV